MYVHTQQCIILSALLIHSAQCGLYDGNVCNSVLETIRIRQPSTSVAFADTAIRAKLNSAEMNIGDDFTTECKNLLLFVNCINLLHPCRGKVWCSESTASDLQEMVQSKCVCSHSYPQCSNRVLQLAAQASLLNIHKAGQTPPRTTCQVVELGEQLQDTIMYFCTCVPTYICAYTLYTHAHTHTSFLH